MSRPTRSAPFGAYRDGMEAYERVLTSKDRQVVELEDWSHYALYDRA